VKYSYEESLKEVMYRGRQFKRRKEDQRILCRLSAAAAAAAVLLAACVAYLTAGIHARAAYTVFGSFMLPAQAGGYVLVGVAAFSAGVAVSLYLKRRNKTKAPDGEQESVK